MTTEPPSWSRAGSGAVLTIDLDALAANYRLLRARATGACAAVVKADGYGLGARIVGRRLAREGCRDYFVAHMAEGVDLKSALPSDARIFVLHGAMPGAEADCFSSGLIPVLNSPEQLDAWAALAHSEDRVLDAILQFDTGMSRMGLSAEETRHVAEYPDRLAGLRLNFVMSHLAVADQPDDPSNKSQLAAFNALRVLFPGVPATLANSSGVFLGSDYHFDLLRPGVALYGANPTLLEPNPMAPVVRLSAKVLNIRTIPAGAGVGYGLTYRPEREARIATIGIGYGDGFLRALGGEGEAYMDGVRLPIAGRVSMDSVGIDVTALPEGRLKVGDMVELLGPDQGVDHLAAAAGTIGYEILTSLGRRFHRAYIGDPGPKEQE